MQSVTSQTLHDDAPMVRESTPSFPHQPFSFQAPPPSYPWMHPAPSPLTTTHTPSTPTSGLPTPSLPLFQLPAMAGPRPSLFERAGSAVPSTVQKRKTGVKGTSSHAKKKRKGMEGQVIEMEESAPDPNDQAGDGLTDLIRVLRSDLTGFCVDLPSPFVVAAEGDVKGDPGLAIQSLGQFVTDQMALVRGGLLLLATRVSAIEEYQKPTRKAPRGERSDQEIEAIKYIKVRTFKQLKGASSWLPQSETHATVQSFLHWKPSDGFGELPQDGDKYQDSDSGNEVEISAPCWDERIDSVKNMKWITNVINSIDGNMKVISIYALLTQKGTYRKIFRPQSRRMTS